MYLTNKDFLQSIRDAKAQGRCTDDLARKFVLLAERYSHRPWFRGYSFREDLVSYAVLGCIANWDKFDETKSNNPFAFFTTAVHRSFMSYLGKEYQQSTLKNDLMKDAGMGTSLNYELAQEHAHELNTREHLE